MTPPESNAAPGVIAQPVVRLTGVRKSFGDQEVLRGVDLELPAHQTTVVLGPSGCGKSVMLKHIVGLLRPDAGEVWFHDTRIDTLPERALAEVRRIVGFLFQLSALFDSMTVEQNLEFPLREHTTLSHTQRREKVAEALDMVDMAGSQAKLPAQLSGGQKKRIALARAIMLEPEVILYDEPTTGLDPERAEDIDRLVVKLKDRLGVTSLVVTHDMVSARRVADRVVMLDQGRVIAEGGFASLARSSDPRVGRFFRAAGVDGPIEEFT
jgi:phospholipid/cholesterol/gamma-HCH transport system ATP-binding protein